MIAIEIGRALFELGEVLDRAQRSLRPVYLLVEHSPQRGAVQPETRGLWPHVGSQMERGIRMKILVAVEAGHAVALLEHLAIFGLVELLLRKRSEQQAKPLHLHRRHVTDHDGVEVAYREQLALGDVTEIRPRLQENGRRELRREVIGEIEVDVEAPQVAMLRGPDLVYLLLREHLAAR
jgi:hypothetical protein